MKLYTRKIHISKCGVRKHYIRCGLPRRQLPDGVLELLFRMLGVMITAVGIKKRVSIAIIFRAF